MTTDLTEVSGINTGKAKRLAGLGIDSLEELAVADAANVLEAVHDLPGHSLGTVQVWIDEARELVATTGSGTSSLSFVVRIARQADGSVVRTTVEPAAPESEQSGGGAGWEGWSPERLTGFLAERCGIAAPTGAAAPSREPSPREEPDVDLDAVLAEVEAARTAELLERMRHLTERPPEAVGPARDVAPRSVVDPSTIAAARDAERARRRVRA